MFRIKMIAGTGLAALVLAALGATAPVASAKNPCAAPVECYGALLNNHVVPLPPGEEPIISIVAEHELEFTGGTLVVNCPQGQFNGSIQSTDGGLQAGISGASFGAAAGGPCGSSRGGAEVSLNPQPFPPKLVLKPNGKAQLTGPISLEISMDEAGLRCSYAAKSLKGTYGTKEEEEIKLGSKPPKFTEQEGSSPGCAKKLTLSPNTWDLSVSVPGAGQAPLVFIG
jgi:hypothetical protein